MESRSRQRRWVRRWDRHAEGYDRQIRLAERYWFGDSRSWICGRASGAVLEVAVGTGLNLEHYPTGVRLTGLDASPGMLDVARRRARRLGVDAELRLADAQALDVPAASFDTVVCTFSLCAIPDHRRALDEMVRALRPGGTLLLADHVAGSGGLVRACQRAVEVVSVPLSGEHYRRRPVEVLSQEMTVHARQRFAFGTVERLVARRSAS